MLVPECHLDLETRSVADLRKVGLYVYAADPTTDVLCASWCVGDARIHTWVKGDPFPSVLGDYLKEGALVYAHNAGFEHALWKHVLGPRYGWPELPFEQMRCTAAMAAAMALPRDLAGAAVAMGMDEQKDMEGKRIMMQLARPRRMEGGVPVWWEPETTPEKFRKLYAYCEQDVEVERALTKRLRPLSPLELKIWQLDHKINTRGVRIDLPNVKRAATLAAKVTDALDRELDRLTHGAVSKVSQAARIVDWLKTQGIDVDSVDKASTRALLAMDLDPRVRRVLEIRQEGAKSSTAKLRTMLDRTNADGRSRETLMYHGASTGRWSAKGIQLQNLPRPMLKAKQIDDVIQQFRHGDPEALEWWGSPMQVLSDCLRGMVIATLGQELVRADYSNIEGRVLAWLAGEVSKLEAFRAFDAKTGPDIYRRTAGGILGISPDDVTDDQRQAYGKVPELALGYGGGKGAFLSMAALYGVDVTEEQAEEIKLGWRAQHPATVEFWWALDNAAMAAVRNPGTMYGAGPTRWAAKGGILWCRLPSGRVLAYVDPQIREVETPWGEMRNAVTYMGVDSITRRWSRHKGYGGHWAENVTQAVARDIMANGMLRVEERGWPVILTVHDEVISEVGIGKVTAEQYAAELCVLPDWAAGLPLAAAGVVSQRYGK